MKLIKMSLLTVRLLIILGLRLHQSKWIGMKLNQLGGFFFPFFILFFWLFCFRFSGTFRCRFPFPPIEVNINTKSHKENKKKYSFPNVSFFFSHFKLPHLGLECIAMFCVLLLIPFVCVFLYFSLLNFIWVRYKILHWVSCRCGLPRMRMFSAHLSLL